MCVTVIGGMDRLKPAYMEIAQKNGHQVKCIPRNEHNFFDKLSSSEAIFVFTNKISHEAKRKAVEFAKSRGIAICFAHSCGISTLRKFFEQLA